MSSSMRCVLKACLDVMCDARLYEVNVGVGSDGVSILAVESSSFWQRCSMIR